MAETKRVTSLQEEEEEVISEFLEAFHLFDKDKNGGIAVKDLETVIRSLDEEDPTAAELHFQGNQTVQFSDLFDFLSLKIQVSDTEEELKEAFKVFDKDQNGFISPNELRQVMISLGEKLSDEEVEQMIKEADLDGDGLVNYDDFVKLMTAVG
ncbi:hypothetical protein M569_13611 [Genlisea aurea]|uniref:EF-hand domain-containing protein n=1 Tax=Genlisea aurea TaxID=192259 RepID=S8C2Z8_9LAMI|nr:hypothetical protein M569_13611 [Genlisea aurea]